MIESIATEVQSGRGTVSCPWRAHMFTIQQRALPFGGPTGAVCVITAFVPPDGVSNMFFDHKHKDALWMWCIPFFPLTRWFRLNDRIGRRSGAASALAS